MSYILEALKKLEQKRRHEERSPVVITFQGEAHKGRAWGRPWILVLSAVFFVAVAAMVWWIGPWKGVPGGDTIKTFARGDVKPAVSVAAPVSPPGKTGAAAASTLEVKAAKEPSPPGAKEVKGTGQAAGKVGTSRTRQASAGAEQAFSDTFPRAEPKPPPGGRILKTADLPASVASALPQLKMSLHYYTPETQSRFARINDMTLREGQSLSEGLKLDEVTEGGAVMNFKGWRFLVPITP